MVRANIQHLRSFEFSVIQVLLERPGFLDHLSRGDRDEILEIARWMDPRRSETVGRDGHRSFVNWSWYSRESISPLRRGFRIFAGARDQLNVI